MRAWRRGAGSRRSFATLWWRTWRFLELDIPTASEPLTLRGLEVHETGYPFEKIGRFDSDDEELNRIFEIGWRTLRVDAHGTFMDSSYWEQLQYAGDTRLEMLISYAMSGDARFGRQAIDAFASSDVEGGIMEGAYPSRGHNVITTFSLAWIGMLHDWWRDLLALNYTTWPESRGDTRSDTHAWSAHPTADLLGIVAGIQSGAPGYAKVRIAPVLGHLQRVDATAATPHGPVSVRYRVRDDFLEAEIRLPGALRGEFIWRGSSHPLTSPRTHLKLSLR